MMAGHGWVVVGYWRDRMTSISAPLQQYEDHTLGEQPAAARWAVSCNCWKVSYKLQYWAMVRMMAKQLCGAGAGSDQSALVQQLRQYGGVTRLDSYFCFPISISGHTLYLTLRPSNCSPTGPRPGWQPWIWSWLTPRWGCRPPSSLSCPTISRRPSLGEDNFWCTCYYIVNYI